MSKVAEVKTLEEWRKNKELSQDRVAAKSQITRFIYLRIENRKRSARVEEALRICAVLGCKVEQVAW